MIGTDLQFQTGADADETDWAADDPVMAGDATRQPAFKNACGVTGICHVCDNCTKNMWTKGLKHTKQFQKCLGALCDLMAHAWLRKLFVHEVLEQQGGGQFAFLFLMESYATIKEWRWGTVMKVFKWVFAIEVPFRRFWVRAHWVTATGRGSKAPASSCGKVELDSRFVG